MAIDEEKASTSGKDTVSPGSSSKALIGWLRQLSSLNRYILYIAPLTLILAIPIVAAFLRNDKTSNGLPKYTIAGTDEKRFWITIESVWLSLWACRVVAYVLPKIARCFSSRTIPGKIQYPELLQRLGNPISLVLWMILNQFAVALFIDTDRTWKHTVQSILKALMICSCILLVKQFVIEILRARRNLRISGTKAQFSDLVALYSAAGSMSRVAEPSALWTTAMVEEEVRAALGSMKSTKQLARHVSRCLRTKKDTLLGLQIRQAVRDRLSGKSSCDICYSDAILDMFISMVTRGDDVLQAINELNNILSLTAFLSSIVVFVMFLSPNLVGALAASATALLSLSFVFATTCQEVLGSCVFLFVKHPYDVGDHVVIDATELVVKRISLLYTVFTRVQTAKMVQTPNIILNSLWVDNVTRSEAVKERVSISVACSTTSKDLVALEENLRHFSAQRKVGFRFEFVDIVNSDWLELQCEMHDRVEEGLHTTRSDFVDALAKALHKTSISWSGVEPA